ncbi:Ufe1p ASCRUDRAFT_77348 [Ascoidea rubescens DSM 1968]|uniref:t-SNARE coiled-coil homology domain-containing protein n=1 Tax=Ascoidea rubescens DSM 1968 TaxID=1344418 RepID=A0A1D2VCQ4_9ASCO|nr:hypothetical protein ASCRUDRAFT_77348 [Ascoidea rubescens DSM 1968]ODV59283.1 hypothetical protein ASCRUDRAFT_77348 [Ascoidea rubescens DSM 1968]
MPDLTSLFFNCIRIFDEENLKEPLALKTTRENSISIEKRNSYFIINDDFNKECTDLSNKLTDLTSLIRELRPSYLLSSRYHDNDFLSSYGGNNDESDSENDSQNEEKDMTEAQKDEFDSECFMMIRNYTFLLAQIEKYEKMRAEKRIISIKKTKKIATSSQLQTINLDQENSIFSKLKSTVGNISSVVNSVSNKDSLELFTDDISKHRSKILLYLKEELEYLSSTFQEMQMIRLNRKKDIRMNDLSNITISNASNIPIDSKIKDNNNNNNFDIQNDANTVSLEEEYEKKKLINENYKTYEMAMQKLTLQQKNDLAKQSSFLLKNKSEELSKIKNLEKSLINIVNISKEISVNLTTQSEQIENLIEVQELNELDVLKGNKNLASSKKKSRRSAKIIIWTSIFLGCFIIVYDFVIW